MLTRVLLAAGAAALAISTPASAGPGDHGGGHGGGAPPASVGGGGDHGPRGGGGPHGGGGAQTVFARGEHGGGNRAAGPVMSYGVPHGHAGGWAAPRSPRGYGGAHGGGWAAFNRGAHGGAPAAFNGRHGRPGASYARTRMRIAHQQVHGFGGGSGRVGRQQLRIAQRQQRQSAGRLRMANGQALGGAARELRSFNAQQAHAFAQQGPAHARQAGTGSFAQRAAQQVASQTPQQQAFTRQQFGIQPLGGHNARNQAARFAVGQYAGGAGASPYSTLAYGDNFQVLPVEQVQSFIGAPLAQVASVAPIGPIPAEISYLYPATPNYYYEWGDGYLYQVDRSDNLIAALIPLVAGGYVPGQYLPASYMASYVPDYYGLDSFYPDSADICNRYHEGVVYQVDCADGYVENVVPMYAGGYGVGQVLPAAYSYYNVPVQYRSMYYNSPNSAYWYSPGAIYQYDPHTSVITSVAALMAPGFTVGQPLPEGYEVYNVPLPYRATYYDTADAWYRYNNGYIYQIDPVTQVVSAIVASLLT